MSLSQPLNHNRNQSIEFATNLQKEVGISDGVFCISIKKDLGYDEAMLRAVLKPHINLETINIREYSNGWRIELRSPTANDCPLDSELQVQLRGLQRLSDLI